MGDHVVISGLNSKAVDFNNTTGILEWWNEDEHRWNVRSATDGKLKSLKEKNLTLVKDKKDDDAPDAYEEEVSAVTHSPEHNGGIERSAPSIRVTKAVRILEDANVDVEAELQNEDRRLSNLSDALSPRYTNLNHDALPGSSDKDKSFHIMLKGRNSDGAERKTMELM